MADQTDQTVYVDLDGAWDGAELEMPSRDMREWGPRLRYTVPAGVMDAFNHALGLPTAPFILYGSGDFHHLASLFVARAAARAGEFYLVSFDNHPDWDVRPPRYGCGGWINRALELRNLASASVWGCGNFELRFPARLFANHGALASGRLQVNAWAERQAATVVKRFDCMTRENWRERFEAFAHSLADKQVYVTVDLDCLAGAATNWENGLYSPEDVAWAIDLLHERATVIAGDVCGAASAPVYARRFQRLAGWWDHPKVVLPDIGDVRKINTEPLRMIWQALTGESPTRA